MIGRWLDRWRKSVPALNTCILLFVCCDCVCVCVCVRVCVCVWDREGGSGLIDLVCAMCLPTYLPTYDVYILCVCVYVPSCVWACDTGSVYVRANLGGPGNVLPRSFRSLVLTTTGFVVFQKVDLWNISKVVFDGLFMAFVGNYDTYNRWWWQH